MATSDAVVLDQIADFGLSRDIVDDTYYTATSGKIPVKWTAPEVHIYESGNCHLSATHCVANAIQWSLVLFKPMTLLRPFSSRSMAQVVMCGAMGC